MCYILLRTLSHDSASATWILVPTAGLLPNQIELCAKGSELAFLFSSTRINIHLNVSSFVQCIRIHPDFQSKLSVSIAKHTDFRNSAKPGAEI